MTQRMHPLSRMVGMLLIAAVAASSAGAEAFMLPAARNTHPAGCHDHAPAPAPAPVSYQCCIAGHNHAVPASLFSGVTLLSYGRVAIHEPLAPLQDFGRNLSAVIAPSPGSPGLTSLRI